MTIPNLNHEGYDRRLKAVHQILQSFGLEATNIEPLAYVPFCPFYFNNYIYSIDLSKPALPSTFPSQPCTTPVPEEGISKLVLRFNNPLAEGMNNANRIQNEVAAQFLARQAVIDAGLKAVVPAVYAWSSGAWVRKEITSENDFAWTMLEVKAGVDFNEVFPELEMPKKEKALDQLAALVAILQQIKLPSGVSEFGALTIDEKGEIGSGQMALLKGGPWSTYAEVWAARLTAQLLDADGSALIDGWKNGDLRERLNAFTEGGGIGKMLNGVDLEQKGLVHGDLTLNNVLYDTESGDITGLIDFDWSAITHPAEEFLFGLWDIGGGLSGRTGRLQPHILSGDFSTRPADLDEEEEKVWIVAKLWNQIAQTHGVKRPSDMKGIEKLMALNDLNAMLFPFELGNEAMLKRIKTEEEKMQKRDAQHAKISAWLDLYASTA